VDYQPPEGPPDARRSLASTLRTAQRESLTDVHGMAVNTALIVRGGVRPLTLQAECGFHAYGEMRLHARELEDPAPGIDRRTRGQILHKALELLWSKFDPNFLTEVEVTFTSVGAKQTVVVLEHRNLERFGERAMELRNGIDAEGGWGIILQSFVAAAES